MSYWTKNRGSLVKQFENYTEDALLTLWSINFNQLRKKKVILDKVLFVHHSDNFYASSYVLTHKGALPWKDYLDALRYNDRWIRKWNPELSQINLGTLREVA
jgi:hypothetical protein